VTGPHHYESITTAPHSPTGSLSLTVPSPRSSKLQDGPSKAQQQPRPPRITNDNEDNWRLAAFAYPARLLSRMSSSMNSRRTSVDILPDQAPPTTQATRAHDMPTPGQQATTAVNEVEPAEAELPQSAEGSLSSLDAPGQLPSTRQVLSFVSSFTRRYDTLTPLLLLLPAAAPSAARAAAAAAPAAAPAAAAAAPAAAPAAAACPCCHREASATALCFACTALHGMLADTCPFYGIGVRPAGPLILRNPPP
jgi:hypothetical protein